MTVVLRGPIEGAKCTECPFAIDGSPNNPVPGIGPEDPDWVIIGEGPGRNEVQARAPFVGPSGAVVNRMLGEIGVDRSRLWVTNSSLCIPPKGSSDEDRDTAATACRPRLNAELARIPGKPLLVLGGPATRAVCPSQLVKITQLAGTYHEVDVDGTGPRAMIPSLHPAFLLHSGGDSKGAGGGHVAAMGYVNLKFDALKVKNLALGNPIKLEINIETEIVDPIRANKLVQDLIVECVNDELIGIDLETYVEDEERNNALQMHIARIRFLGLSSKNRAISVLWEHLTPQTINSFRAILANKRVTKVFHNLTYDTGVLQNRHYRFRVDGDLEDTLLGHHAAFPGLRHALQGVACQFRGIPPWKSEFKDGRREGIENDAEEAVYNATDIFATVKTVAPIHVWIKKTKTERVYEIDRKMAKCAARMHLDGIMIDPDVNAELDRRYSLATKAAREQILDTFESMRDKVLDRLAFERAKVKRKKDPEDFVERIAKRLAEEQKAIAKGTWDFSPGKDMHMIALLKAKNVPLTKMTDTGRTSTAASVLEDLAHVPEVASLLRFRSNEKLAGFNRRMFQWTVNSQKKNVPPFVQDDGRIHPIWSVNKLSGRWGSEDPACFDAETDILTKRGWIKFPDLAEDDRVAQYDKDTRQITFVSPSARHAYRHRGEMVKWSGRNVDLLMTPNHRLLVHGRKTDKPLKVITADALKMGMDYRIPTAGAYGASTKSKSIDTAFLRFLVAAQADGSRGGRTTDCWVFGFSKRRKIKRLRSILRAAGFCWSESSHTRADTRYNPPRLSRVTTLYVPVQDAAARAWQILGDAKTFGPWLLNLHGDLLDAFLDEIMYWDGCSTRKNNYSSSVKVNADWVQAVAHLRGRRGRMRVYRSGKLQKKDNWQVDITNNASAMTSQLEVQRVPWNDMVYCVTVPTGFIVVRRGQNVVITGNCQNVSEGDEQNKDVTRRLANLRRQYVAPPGRVIIAFDFEQLEARTMALQSDDPFLCKVFAEKKDIHAEFAVMLFPEFANLVPKSPAWVKQRNITKRLEYGGVYGGSDDTVWKSIVVDFPEISLKMVSIAIKKMKVAVAGVLRWQQWLFEICSRPPYELRSYILGRRRVFPMGDPSPTDVNNNPNQFTGSDIMNVGLANMIPRLEKYRGRVIPIAQIHDAAYFECDDNDRMIQQVGRDVTEAFTQYYKSPSGIEIDFPIELKYGYAMNDKNDTLDAEFGLGRPGLGKLKLAS